MHCYRMDITWRDIPPTPDTLDEFTSGLMNAIRSIKRPEETVGLKCRSGMIELTWKTPFPLGKSILRLAGVAVDNLADELLDVRCQRSDLEQEMRLAMGFGAEGFVARW